MSRLHRVGASFAGIAAHFDAEGPVDLVVPAETIAGEPGLVVFERAGRRHLRALDWGFPRPNRTTHGASDGPSRIGLVADLTNPMWERLVVEPRYRCLIVLTHFANPDGVRGAKTKTWYSIADMPIAAWAGFCRTTQALGPVYAGMTMTANAAIPPTNDRMPVLLEPHDYDRWLHGTIEDVIGFQFRAPIAAERMIKEVTDDPWALRGAAHALATQPSLL